MTRATADEILDVAIVGAGVSGIYSGWRLLAATGATAPRRVAVFEAGNRVGGRLLSVAPPGLPDARVEIGGMRYTSTHYQVAGLVQMLNLPTENFVVGQDRNLAYLRGRRLRTSDLSHADRVPYRIDPDARRGLAIGMPALAAERFLSTVLKQKKVNLKTVDWARVAATGRYEGNRLQDVSLRYVFERAVGREAFQFAFDTSGYDSIFSTWSTADGFPWNLGDYGAEISYSHVKDGYLTIVLKLQQMFQQAGGEVRLRQRLTGFDVVTLGDGSQGVQLEFARGASRTPATVLARKLVLAMPRRSIELLEPRGQVLDPGNTRVRRLIESVTPIPLFKIALAYNTRWWQPLGITRGQTVTDLPIRQCYYWPVEDPKTKRGIILVYDDGSDLDYWAALRSHPEQYQSAARSPGGVDGLPDWNNYPAPKLMVDEVHRQLLLIHGIKPRKAYEPYAAAYRDWGEDPFGGGANFWSLGVDSQKVSRQVIQPMPKVPVFICGEAWSHAQGWVEGALATAEQMLQGPFGLGKPPAPLTSPGQVPGARTARRRR